jgi:hypothetical protein
MPVAAVLGGSLLSGLTSSVMPNRSQQIQQDFKQLGQDLKSGNLSQAQSDFTTLQKELQQNGSKTGHHWKRPGLAQSSAQQISQQSGAASLLGQLGQALQSGNLTAAQQTYSIMQQDFQQFASTGASGSASASTAGSTSLNVTA